MSTVSSSKLTPLPSPIKGKADWREFRCFRLENGVTVCLGKQHAGVQQRTNIHLLLPVHDKESKTTAAAATVNVGAAADPRELPGLARKYPAQQSTPYILIASCS